MGKSVHEIHMEWVEKLKERGETILQPKYGKPMNRIDGYIKTENPFKNAGAIFQDKDGTFGLFCDMGALHITGIKWEDLGLCDARCWYEWMNPETYKPTTTIWTYNNKVFSTKTEKDMYAQGFEDGLLEGQKRYLWSDLIVPI